MNDDAGTAPLTESAFHILLALADGERHGYAIGKDVAAVTDGAIRLGSATLYRQLRQMLSDGWIVEIESNDDDDVGRRYYRLTPRGRRMLRAEAERLRNLVRVAVRRRVLPAAGV
jgi:DNA-binding PadR family transcriptional regulator